MDNPVQLDTRPERASDASSATDGVQPGPARPPWELVHFRVECPRCGEDLHERTEPSCPSCSLQLDWQELVPLEKLRCSECGYHLYGLHGNRCPECGEGFHWEQVLFEYRRRLKPFFEYHAHSRPFRSCWRSLALTLRPKKLWCLADLHDPPAPRGLALLWVISILFFVFAWPVLTFFTHWATSTLEIWAWRNRVPWMRGSSAFDPGTWPRSWYAWWVATWFAWAFGGLGALLILRQSMARCRVLNRHVLRVWIYALLPAAFAPALFVVLVFLADLLLMVFPSETVWNHRNPICLVVVVFVWVWVVLLLGAAYRYYVKMKHPWWVALLVQMIAVLVACLVASRSMYQ